MDARCIRIKKIADTKISGYLWTGLIRLTLLVNTAIAWVSGEMLYRDQSTLTVKVPSNGLLGRVNRCLSRSVLASSGRIGM